VTVPATSLHGQVLSFATDWYWEGYYLASNYPADWQTHRKNRC